jgi:hypothetical protein
MASSRGPRSADVSGRFVVCPRSVDRASKTAMNARDGSAAAIEPEWATWTDEQLLDLRLCDLRLSIAAPRWRRASTSSTASSGRSACASSRSSGSPTEWFTPDGVPGMRGAVLPHPSAPRRAGAADDRRGRGRHRRVVHAHPAPRDRPRDRQRLPACGGAKAPAPVRLVPGRTRSSTNRVPTARASSLHLEPWYAQSHPDEDFAETFAVWMTPHSDWRSAMFRGRCCKKLEYMDELMSEIRDWSRRSRTRREQVEPLRESTKTLREHYERSAQRYGLGAHNVYDRDLRRLFPNRVDDPAGRPLGRSLMPPSPTSCGAKSTRWTGRVQVHGRAGLSRKSSALPRTASRRETRGERHARGLHPLSHRTDDEVRPAGAAPAWL